MKKGVITFTNEIHYRTMKNTFASIRRRSMFIGLKRVSDVFFSFIVIIGILSWLTPIIAVVILLNSRGSIFFRQRRVGRYGKTFTCFKFRTMENNIEADFKQAKENDPRITKVGHFLRITNLDELPQFFNVFWGDMSLIGPRPHMHKDCRDFSVIVKDYKLRNLVRPGITGLAQIKGLRGPTNDNFSIIHRFKWDVFYVNKFSFGMDMVIMVYTISQTISHIFSNIFVRDKFQNREEEIQLQSKKQVAA
jgi:putative colanic acid biosysnthesis UDP-glucose lipid carrier transferase